jgi:phosphoribosylformimino-5-aminoimidazole carboxamide ribotide isomerase
MNELIKRASLKTERPLLNDTTPKPDDWGFIIPAIDIIDGKCVRLTKGDYNQKKIYNENPLEIAKQFEDAGMKRLHLVDLDGAKAGDVKNWKVLELIAAKTNLLIDFSGGISTKKNVSICFESGAAFAAVGSIAVKDEAALSEWLTEYGVQKFIIGADVNNELLAIKGWTEKTSLSVFDLVEKYKTKGVKQFFCTDISKDGLLQGTGIDLYKKIMNQHPSIDLIASGGVSSIKDLLQLREAGCHGAIVGKAIYENRISLADLRIFNN